MTGRESFGDGSYGLHSCLNSVVLSESIRFETFKFRFSHRTVISFQWSVFREDTSLRPAAVSRYFCNRLFGLSGMVCSRIPAFNSGSK